MYRTWLIPYLEGTLNAAQRMELEARLAVDPALASDLDTLRRTLPRLRAALRPPVLRTMLAASVWAQLEARLPEIRSRRSPAASAWWAAGIAVAVLLLASSVADRRPNKIERHDDARRMQALHHVPLIVFHRDNQTETPAAARLEQRALHVAAERDGAS